MGLLRARGKHRAAREVLSKWIPIYEAQLAASPDDLSLRCDLAGLHAANGDMRRYDREWVEIRHELASGTTACSGNYAHLPLALAQAGELDRALQVIRAFPNPDLGMWMMATAGMPHEKLFRGGRTADLLKHAEMLKFRAKLDSERARLRSRYLWATGSIDRSTTRAQRDSKPLNATGSM